MKKITHVEQPVDFANVGEKISHELAAKMVKNHHDKYGFENSYTYVTGKQVILDILSQPGCAGLKVIEAVNQSGQNTVVFVGIDVKGNNLTQITTVNDMGKLVVTEGMVADKSRTTTTWSD